MITTHSTTSYRNDLYALLSKGGIAFGLDRFIMLLGVADSIQDVIALSKAQRAHCSLMDAPSSVSPDQR